MSKQSSTTTSAVAARSSVFRSFSLLLAGAALGWTTSVLTPTRSLQADDRRNPPPVAFLSGGERSAEILEKIVVQLTTMDKRLANIETAVATPGPAASPLKTR